ncbi:MAG TPA: VOC family protein [Kiritimatiellia bacterium]|nr:VOC family protein [Kiritimatiellia bacterium]
MNRQFHHIGVACRDLDAEAACFAAAGYVAEAPDFEDPVQGVAGRFLVGGGPRLELLRPLGGHSVLAPWLKGGAKFYHLAYEVPDLEAALTELRKERAKVVVPPVPAVAFQGRRIAFVLFPNLFLMELIAQATE